MSWVDDLFNNPIIIYLALAFFLLHIYLKKTGQTLPEVIERVKELFKGKEE